MFYLFTHQIQPLSTSQLLIQIQLCLIQCLNFRRLKFSENVHLEIFLFFENSEKKALNWHWRLTKPNYWT